MVKCQGSGPLEIFENFKLKLSVFLVDHIVAMVTSYVKKIATCLPKIAHLYITIIVASH